MHADALTQPCIRTDGHVSARTGHHTQKTLEKKQFCNHKHTLTIPGFVETHKQCNTKFALHVVFRGVMGFKQLLNSSTLFLACSWQTDNHISEHQINGIDFIQKTILAKSPKAKSHPARVHKPTIKRTIHHHFGILVFAPASPNTIGQGNVTNAQR